MSLLTNKLKIMQIQYFTEQFFKKRLPKTFDTSKAKNYYINREKFKNIIKIYENKIWNKDFKNMDEKSKKVLFDLLRDMLWK